MVTAYRNTHGVNTVILRIFNTYGPRMRPNDGRVIPTFIRQALDGEPLTVAGDGQQTRSVCYVSDLVTGILTMAADDHPGPINLGNPSELTVEQIARDIIAVTGSDAGIRYVPRPQDDPQIRRPDTTLAQQVLRWSPNVQWAEGIERTVESMRPAVPNPA